MSFKQIKYTEIINEDWEDSDLYNVLNSRFFLIIFQLNKKGIPELKRVKFWNMTETDLEVVRNVWEDTRKKILKCNFNNFIKISDNQIAHVRPKAKNSADQMVDAYGKMQKKKSFWLNASFISKIIQ